MPRKTFRKRITSNKLTKKINNKNIILLERFLKEKSQRSSETTLKVYKSNLIMFFTWNLLHNENKFFIDIKKLEFSDFFSFAIEELQVGSSKINNMRSVLSSLSNFIEKFYDEDYPDFRNVILKTIESVPKEVRREKTIFTDEQIDGLLLRLSENDKQQACWVALAVTSGARFSELLNFTVNLIDEERAVFNGLFLETTSKIKTKGRGKAGKMIHKYILKDKFLPYYNAWLTEREELLKKEGLEHDYLFTKINGEPATESVIRGWIEGFEKYLDVPFYAHALRHYLTTLLVIQNIPASLIKELFGWESVDMVDVYSDVTMKDMNYPELENLKNI